jgi:hypothetical protein
VRKKSELLKVKVSLIFSGTEGGMPSWTILAGMLEVMVVASEEMLDGCRGVAVPVRGVKVETLELLFVLGNLLEQAGGRGVIVHIAVERHSCGGKAFVLLVVGELAGVQCVAYMCRK